MGHISVWRPSGGGGGLSPEALADNLTALGIASSAKEGADALLEKMLHILEHPEETFAAALAAEWDVSYGFFSAGETVRLGEVVTVSAAVRVTELRFTVTGEGVPTLTGTGEGWRFQLAGNTLTASFAPGGVLPMPAIRTALEAIALAGDGETHTVAGVTLSAVTASGAVLPATGTAGFTYAYSMTWALLPALYPDWRALDGKTWAQVEKFTKP